MRIGKKELTTEKKTYLMGILNITPDSFSDSGKYMNISSAMTQVTRMIDQGVDIIDIGGESARPGYLSISVEEEIARILPVIESIRKDYNIPISVDTTKPAVARETLLAGADMINDISCLQTLEMAMLVAETGCSYCLMHNQQGTEYDDFMKDMLSTLRNAVGVLKEAGVQDGQIVVDPGIGFAKTYEQNIEAIRQVDQLQELGYPILLGVSRKSVIGNTLLVPTGERMEGTLALSVYGAMKGCSIFRVHDVLENARALQMIEALIV